MFSAARPTRLALRGSIAGAVLIASLTMTACGGSTQAAAGPAASTPTASGTTAPKTAPATTQASLNAAPSEAATPLPSWAKAMGLTSVAPTTVLTPEQTCDAVKDVTSTTPAGVKDKPSHVKWMRDQLTLVRDHSAPATKADMSALVEYANKTVALLPGEPDAATAKQYWPNWKAVYAYCPNWKKPS